MLPPCALFFLPFMSQFPSVCSGAASFPSAPSSPIRILPGERISCQSLSPECEFQPTFPHQPQALTLVSDRDVKRLMVMVLKLPWAPDGTFLGHALEFWFCRFGSSPRNLPRSIREPGDSDSGSVLMEHGRTLISRVRDFMKRYGGQGISLKSQEGRTPESSQSRSPAGIRESHCFVKKNNNCCHCYKDFLTRHLSPSLGRAGSTVPNPGGQS